MNPYDGVPFWAVPQSELKPLSELRALIHTRMIRFPVASGEVLVADYDEYELQVMARFRKLIEEAKTTGERLGYLREAQLLHEIKARLDARIVPTEADGRAAEEDLAGGRVAVHAGRGL
jgi:hypothetical protein